MTKRLALAAACAVLALLSWSDAAASVRFDVDVLWTPDPDDDVQVFLHASNMAYPMPRERVRPIFHQMHDPYEDYPVLAFIAHHGHVDLRTVWSYRRRGYAWFDVMVHFGVRPDRLFVRLPHDPGPPYGRAYGHWRRHRNRMDARFVRDDDVRHWVHLRAVSAYTGVAPARVWEMSRDGRRFERVAGNKYREKHGRGHKADRGRRGRGDQEAGFGSPGRGKGKGHGKDRDHHDRD
ncbi:MAG TPA: hypothetical protein VJV23_15175 [Candidatus Polarisedimenticolia bacterium]|nr:hypothetical protein [Candidatus Polarisedimenticolia bacterium]